VGYVTVGGGLDDWLEDAADGPGSLLHLRIVDGPELAAMGTTDHEHGSGNPHVWLDPILVRDHVLPRVADFLTEILPSDRRAIMDRASAWTDSMTALDGEIRDLLVGSHERRFIATHDAWSHFAARYRLQSLGSLYERPGHEPSARGLADLIEGARGAGITTVLTEPQLATTAARAIAAELGAEIGVVDPLGGPGLQGRERYCDLMRFNARSFAAALAAR
jgi:zinc transport system substrate-binding protein